MNRYENKIVWVTGAETALGYAAAAAFAGEGARLILSGLAEPPEDLRASTILASDEKLFSDETAGDIIKRAGGRADVLIHANRRITLTSIEDFDEKTWDDEMDEIARTAFVATRAAGISIALNKINGAILYISSLHGDKPTTTAFIFSAACGAVSLLMKEAALEFGRKNIRVNMLEAGTYLGDDSNITSYVCFNPDTILRKIALGRRGTPAEIIAPALWLCSDEASFVNGASLRVDGGQMLWNTYVDAKKRWENVRA